MTSFYLLFLWFALQTPAVSPSGVPQTSVPAQQTETNPQQPNAQAAGSTVQASARYQFGPGDTFRVLIWDGNESKADVITVGPDGTALIPFSINRLIKIEGLTQAETQALLLSELKKNYLNPAVQVIALGVTSRRALLVADTGTSTAHTGYFPITGDETVLEFVTQNGAYGGNGNMASVQLKKAADGSIHVINLTNTLLKNDPSGLTLMEPNDTVYIPSLQTVSNETYVISEGRTGVLLQTPNKITLLEALTKGNAFAAGSRLESVSVIRIDPKNSLKPLVYQVRFTDLYKKANPGVNMTLENGDIVFVAKSRTVKMQDYLNSISPLLSFVETTLFFSQIFKTGS